MTNSKASKEPKNLLRKIYHWSLEEIKKPYADFFIAGFSFLEAIIIPIPTDPLLIARATAKPKRAFFIAFYVTVTSLLGATTGYFIGSFFWKSISPFLYTYIFSESTYMAVYHGLKDNVFLFVFLGAFSPLPFKVFSLAAGSMNLALLPFALGAFFGRGLRYFILGGLIYFFGDSIRSFIEKRLEAIFMVVTVLVVLVLILKIFVF